MSLEPKFSPEVEEMLQEVRSFAEAQDESVTRYCEECGEECKTGQMLFNGWFMNMGLYHLECAPEETIKSLRRK